MPAGNSPPGDMTDSSGCFMKFTSFAADIDLRAQTNMPPRVPRMIAWNSGVLNVERADGTAVLMPSWLAGMKIEESPTKILSASTTATEAMVWW